MLDVMYDPPRGELTSSHIPTTISEVSIITVLKGDATPGKTLDVVQLGGRLEGSHSVEPNITLMAEAKWDSVVLFLTLPDAGAYRAINLPQGMFLIEVEGTATPPTGESGFQVTTLDVLQDRVDGA